MTAEADRLIEMSPRQLEELFRTSPPGPIPAGECEGTFLVASGTRFAEPAAALLRRLAWQGKVFSPQQGYVVNKVLPWGRRAVGARVYKGLSRLDGGECIVLDYSPTSLIARSIRDELREVHPGVYLGLVYAARIRAPLRFSLDFRNP